MFFTMMSVFAELEAKSERTKKGWKQQDQEDVNVGDFHYLATRKEK